MRELAMDCNWAQDPRYWLESPEKGPEAENCQMSYVDQPLGMAPAPVVLYAAMCSGWVLNCAVLPVQVRHQSVVV